MDRFEPLTNEQQKLVLRLFVDMYLEMREKLEKHDCEDEKITMANRLNYEIVIQLFTKGNEFFNAKYFYLKEAKKLIESDILPKA